jgi:hypothetical protein
VLLPEGYTAPLPIEIKSKYQSAIDEMKVGSRKPDQGHIFQTKVQLALIRHEQENGGLWSDLDPVTHFKKTCKLDFEQGVDKLTDSVGINRAKLVREDYDYTESRKRVLDRWKKG